MAERDQLFERIKPYALDLSSVEISFIVSTISFTVKDRGTTESMRWLRRLLTGLRGALMPSASKPWLEMFGRCTHGHRARLIYYDQAGRHQEPWVHSFGFGVGSVGGVNVYRVDCPQCGEPYTTTDRGVERVES